MIKPEDIEGVIREALNRYDDGRLTHGELDLDTDKRDFINEAEQELLDCINYCVFQMQSFQQFFQEMWQLLPHYDLMVSQPVLKLRRLGTERRKRIIKAL